MGGPEGEIWTQSVLDNKRERGLDLNGQAWLLH